MKILLIAAGVQGFSTENSEDAEFAADLTLYCSIFFVLLMCMLSICSKAKKGLLGGLIWLILFLQYSRWTLLIDYKSSPFAKAFWQRINYLFDKYELWNSSNNPPEQKFQDIGIQTSDFLSNAEEQLLLVLVCFLLTLICRFYFLKIGSSLLGWGFLVAYTDILLFALIQFQEISAGSLVNLLNFAASGLAVVFYLWLFLVSLLKFCKGRLGDSSLLTSEFKVNHMYYPFVILTRGSAMFLYVFLPDNGTLQIACLVAFEAFIILYLMLTIPYKTKINNVFGIFYHLVQTYVISMPYLNENDYFHQADSALVFSVAGLLILCLIRMIYDFSQKTEEKSESKISCEVSEIPNNGNSDLSGQPRNGDETFYRTENAQVLQPPKVNLSATDNDIEVPPEREEIIPAVKKPIRFDFNDFFRSAVRPAETAVPDRVIITRSPQGSNFWRKLPDINKITVRREIKKP